MSLWAQFNTKQALCREFFKRYFISSDNVEQLLKRWFSLMGRVDCFVQRILQHELGKQQRGSVALHSAHSLLGSLSSSRRADGAGLPAGSYLESHLALWDLLLEMGRCCSFFSVIPLATARFCTISSRPYLLTCSTDSMPCQPPRSAQLFCISMSKLCKTG